MFFEAENSFYHVCLDGRVKVHCDTPYKVGAFFRYEDYEDVPFSHIFLMEAFVVSMR